MSDDWGKGGFSFIASILDINFELPVQITPYLRLQRASSEQIEIVKRSLERNSGFINISHSYYYESNQILETSNETSSYKTISLDEKDWRYNILSYSGSNYNAHQFLNIANLLPPYIISFSEYLTSEEYGKGELRATGGDEVAQKIFYSLPIFKVQKFEYETLEKSKILFEKFCQLDTQKYEGIIRAIGINYKLRRIAVNDDLYVLGLFMIIEMLLTHNPNDKEVGDSLTHQIKTKIAFIAPRLLDQFDYSNFENISPDKIWGSLYHYRSCIAHGNHIDFKDRKLSPLGSREKAVLFLTAVTKNLLAYAISEPDVVNGLKPI